MPRFYLHLQDGERVCDETGMVFDGLDGAREEAVRTARDMMADQVRRGRLSLRDRIEIFDEAGRRLLIVPFREAVRLEE
jgi:hypothetical protein